MTDEQINQRIAEACGWTDFVVHPQFGLMGASPDTRIQTAVDYYTADLNAMHEAEKVLGKKLSEYGNQLCEMTIVSKDDFPECYIWHATARQRAETFLRTIGKWHQSGDATEMVKEVQK